MRVFLATFFAALFYKEASHLQNQRVITHEGVPHRTFPTCQGCVPRELIVAPGFGFDLTSTYGTAVVRYFNGTVVDIGRVDGKDIYVELMQRLSAPYNLNLPPFDNPWDDLRWRLDEAKRALRRYRGMPSTEDVRTLGQFLFSLRLLAIRKLGMDVRNVLAAIPRLPNLQRRDFDEAMQYAGLVQVQSYKYYNQMQELNAAWAGMGYGLCKHWGDIEKCDDEDREFKGKSTLSLSFTKMEFIIEKALLWDAHSSWTADSFRYNHLGYQNHLNSPSNGTFWEEIGSKVIEFANKTIKMEELLLMGEHAEEKKFLDTIWSALGDLDLTEVYTHIQKPGFNATYVVARGVAELAKRWEGQPYGCVEGNWCDNRKPGDDDLKEELRLG